MESMVDMAVAIGKQTGGLWRGLPNPRSDPLFSCWRFSLCSGIHWVVGPLNGSERHLGCHFRAVLVA